MSNQIVPLNPVPSQTVSVTLNGQALSLNVYQRSTGLYIDVSMNGVPLPSGVLCLNGVRIIRDKYWNFIGDLAFIDTEGSEDPSYSGLGSRWVLVYTNP
jgi:hypothetical protein